MSDTVLVTIAAGCHVSVSPHPSGIAGVKPLVLSGGNTLTVTRGRAAELYGAGLVLHPLTGEMPPAPVAMQGDVKISREGGPWRSASDPLQDFPNWAGLAEHKQPEPPPRNPWGDRDPPTVTRLDDFPALARIVDADGRSWPSY